MSSTSLSDPMTRSTSSTGPTTIARPTIIVPSLAGSVRGSRENARGATEEEEERRGLRRDGGRFVDAPPSKFKPNLDGRGVEGRYIITLNPDRASVGPAAEGAVGPVDSLKALKVDADALLGREDGLPAELRPDGTLAPPGRRVGRAPMSSSSSDLRTPTSRTATRRRSTSSS